MRIEWATYYSQMAFNFKANRDDKLVAKLRLGDEEAFEKLYKKFSRKVYCVARKMDLGHEDAEGIVQEAFLKIWRNRQNLDASLSFNAYLLTITKSLIIKAAKKRVQFNAYQNYAISYYSVASNETEDYVIFSDLNTVSSKVLDELPPKQKQVFMMKNFQHLPVELIAKQLQLSKRTVENQIYRANKVVKAKLIEMKILSLHVMVLFSWIA